MAKSHPYTRMTLTHLKDLGYEPGLVERRLPAHKGQMGVGKKVDLFGCLDIVAMHDGYQGLVGIQSTSNGALSDHIKKIKAEPRAEMWVRCGNPLLLFAWRKVRQRKKDGSLGLREVFEPRVFRFTNDSFRPNGRPDEIEFGRKR